MIKEVTAVGKDILEAKENARVALGAGELEDVQFEIIDAGTRGFFGFMARPAKVRAYVETPDAPERKPRFERPKKERVEAEGTEEKQNAADGGERSERKPRHKNNHKKKDRPERREAAVVPEASPAEEKPKSEVIPEDQLKMERREVKDGEDTSYDFVKTLLSDIGLNSVAELYACEDGTRRITIVGEDASTLIGHHGDTLDALQYLANLASMKKNINGERDKSRVTIDIEGYRRKREETLRALARRMAAKALRNKRSVMLEPMSAYERRIIHSEVQGIEGVSTISIGTNNNRKIVIYLTDKKPKGIFDEEEKTVTPLSEEFAPDETVGANGAEALDEYAHTEDEKSEGDTVAVERIQPADELADDEEDIK